MLLYDVVDTLHKLQLNKLYIQTRNVWSREEEKIQLSFITDNLHALQLGIWALVPDAIPKKRKKDGSSHHQLVQASLVELL